MCMDSDEDKNVMGLTVSPDFIASEGFQGQSAC